ncbi:unnamed protein product [Prorocentrum cordatum]|uniref:Uncharacterized protein n=1 Tax=Prorocentrum cordatum TaxID=2364126 RepID=A0ABN9Y6D1_9DINO|nr:unnamed protein product [Polarella glacialis]
MLAHVADARWVIYTPDADMCEKDDGPLNGDVTGVRACRPDGIIPMSLRGANIYNFGVGRAPDQATFRGLMEEAADLVALGGGAVAAAVALPEVWLFTESNATVAIGDECLAGPEVVLHKRGPVHSTGDILIVGSVPKATVEQWRRTRAGTIYARVMTARFNPAGERCRPWSSVAETISESAMDHWQGTGPRTATWVTRVMACRNSGPEDHHRWWRATAKLNASDWGVAENGQLSSYVEAAGSMDQLELSNLVVIEKAAGRPQTVEYHDGGAAGDAAGVTGSAVIMRDEMDLFEGRQHVNPTVCCAPSLVEHASKEFEKESQIQKQARKAREERALLRQPPGKGGGGRVSLKQWARRLSHDVAAALAEMHLGGASSPPAGALILGAGLERHALPNSFGEQSFAASDFKIYRDPELCGSARQHALVLQRLRARGKRAFEKWLKKLLFGVVSDNGVARPRLTVTPMGGARALCWCQTIHEEILSRSFAISSRSAQIGPPSYGLLYFGSSGGPRKIAKCKECVQERVLVLTDSAGALLPDCGALARRPVADPASVTGAPREERVISRSGAVGRGLARVAPPSASPPERPPQGPPLEAYPAEALLQRRRRRARRRQGARGRVRALPGRAALETIVARAPARQLHRRLLARLARRPGMAIDPIATGAELDEFQAALVRFLNRMSTAALGAAVAEHLNEEFFDGGDQGAFPTALRRLAPGESRPPAPASVFVALANELVARGGLRQGAAILAAHRCYLRPGELSRATWSMARPPVSASGPGATATLALRPFEQGVSSNTGAFDETVQIDWPPLCLAGAGSVALGESAVQNARELGLDDAIGELMMHRLQHSGPSADFLVGRWSWTAASGRRMAAPSPPDATGAIRKPGFTWNEARQRVQHSDGSVRTSVTRILDAGGGTAASPPRPRAIASVGHPGPVTSFFSKASSSGTAELSRSSRGGSSRGGSSWKSSRSSSCDPHGRDGDISSGPGPGSRCSSGGWDTSTNSSEHSRPRTPPDVAPSPNGPNGLLMPDPIRTSLMLPPTLFDDDQVTEGKAEQPPAESSSRETPASAELAACAQPAADPRVVVAEPSAARAQMGPLLKRDPFGRDVPCRREPPTKEWSVDPLVKYLRGVVQQIEHNIQNHCVPTAEKLDAFVSRLMANTERHVRRAPKKRRHALQVLLSRRNFARHENQRVTTPEELKTTLNSVIEDLLRDISGGSSTCPSS